jgi:very-short-patch-repair endonuclease
MPLVRTRELRRRETVAERLLWNAIRNRQIGGAKFRRQVPIAHYTVGFACLEHRIVIELEGGEPAEPTAHELRRTEALTVHGYRQLRISNNEVMRNIQGVIQTIESALANPR